MIIVGCLFIHLLKGISSDINDSGLPTFCLSSGYRYLGSLENKVTLYSKNGTCGIEYIT